MNEKEDIAQSEQKKEPEKRKIFKRLKIKPSFSKKTKQSLISILTLIFVFFLGFFLGKAGKEEAKKEAKSWEKRVQIQQQEMQRELERIEQDSLKMRKQLKSQLYLVKARGQVLEASLELWASNYGNANKHLQWAKKLLRSAQRLGSSKVKQKIQRIISSFEALQGKIFEQDAASRDEVLNLAQTIGKIYNGP
jgi:hypothetical protein